MLMTTRKRKAHATAGERLIQWRTARRLSQGAAADVLGISQSYLCLLEQNRRYASVRVAPRLAAISGVPILALLGIETGRTKSVRIRSDAKAA